MHTIRFLIIFLAGLLVGCNTLSNQTDESVQISPPVLLDAESIQVQIQSLPGWSSFVESDNIMLSEFADPMHEDGSLKGIVLEVWLPDVSDFDIPDDHDFETVQELLDEIIHLPHVAGQTPHTEPSPFSWSGHDSAFYLLNDSGGTAALVMLVSVLETKQLVGFRLSIASDESERLAELLPQIFHDVQINNQPLDTAFLSLLPDPLIFPEYPRICAHTDTKP